MRKRVVAERDLGRQRGAQAAGREIAEAVVRDRTSSGSSSAIAIALIVKSRRDRSVFDVVGERDLRLAAVVAVDLGAERRDLERIAVLLAADGPEPLTLQPHRVGPALEHAARSRRAGRRS